MSYLKPTKRRIIRMVAVMLAIWMTPVIASATTKDTQTTIRVGYYEDGDYMSLNQQGEYVGYNMEFLQEIAKHSGLSFDIVDTKSWTEAYSMLVDGEIDLLPAVYYSQERAKEIQFMTQPMCSIYTTLNVRMDDDRYDYDDFDAFQGMQVGIIKGGEDGMRFREFCQENQIILDITEYNETNELLSALDGGTLDGAAITHLGKNSSYRSVAQFSPSSLYFAVSAKKPDLLAEMNRSMNQILLNNPGYITDLYDKYLSPGSNQVPVFTSEESEYIKQADVITVSYDPDFAPLSYQDKSSGQFKGVTADIFSFIQSNSGLRFRFEPHSQPEAQRLLQQGMIDVLCISDGDYLWDRKNGINSTLYYLRTPTSAITKGTSSNRSTLALLEGYQLSDMVSKDYPDSKIQYYATVSECLSAVDENKADAAYLNTQVAGYFLDDSVYSGLVETTLGKYANKLCIGVSSSFDPRLFSILNKCIKYLPAEQVDASMIKNSADARDVSLIKFVEQHTWPVILCVCLVLGVVILLISINLKTALRSNRQIQKLRYKDTLTCLDNLNGFSEKWQTLTEGGRRRNLVLLYSDICQFKLINDTFGFGIGDKVLQVSSQVLSEELEQGECCARVSADNFVLLLRYENWNHMVKRLESCAEKLNRWRKENTELTYNIELVFGVYLIDQAKDMDLRQVMDFANFARRYAKSVPGSFAVLYDERMRKKAVLDRELESSLEPALINDEFEVYYQPKVSMADGKVIGCEALIRWNHPEKGFLTPGVFIPFFEKNGMVKKVDFWLFESVCRSMQTWSAQGKQLLPVSCNFSRLHFKEEGFPEKICSISDRYQIPRDLLEIEITESALIDDSDCISAVLPRLKELGFQISIDDFGSGYSSLGQLQQLAVDVLKLDRSFVAQGVTGTREQIVLRNVIHMVKELGMTVICEGVETLAQAELLQTLGGRFAQGYYFHRPMTITEYQKLW